MGYMLLYKISNVPVFKKRRNGRWMRTNGHPLLMLKLCDLGRLFLKVSNFQWRLRTWTRCKSAGVQTPLTQSGWHSHEETWNQTAHNTCCRKCSGFHNSLLNIWQVASLLYNDFILPHYSFVVRKTSYDFSLVLSRRKKNKKDLFLNKTFPVYQIQPHFKAILIVKMSIIHKSS